MLYTNFYRTGVICQLKFYIVGIVNFVLSCSHNLDPDTITFKSINM